MAVTLDANSTTTGFNVTSVSYTHTPAGTPSAVAVGAYGFVGIVNTWACTYGGTTAPPAFTQVSTNRTDLGNIFGLANPSSGAQTVFVDCGPSAGAYPCIVTVTVTGSDITTVFDAAGGSFANSGTALSTTITGGTSADYVFAMGGSDGGGPTLSSPGSGGNNTTVIYTSALNGGEAYAASSGVGAATFVATYTSSISTQWIMMAASFQAAAVAAAAPFVNPDFSRPFDVANVPPGVIGANLPLTVPQQLIGQIWLA
jgi:hypothetical protein